MARERNYNSVPNAPEAPLAPKLREIIGELERWRAPLEFPETPSLAYYDRFLGYLSNDIDTALGQNIEESIRLAWDALGVSPESDEAVSPVTRKPKKQVGRDELIALRGWWKDVLKIEGFDHPGSVAAFKEFSEQLAEDSGHPDLFPGDAEEEPKPRRIVTIEVTDTTAQVAGSKDVIRFATPGRDTSYYKERRQTLVYFQDNPDAEIPFRKLWSKVSSLPLDGSKHPEIAHRNWLNRFKTPEKKGNEQIFIILDEKRKPKDAIVSVAKSLQIVLEQKQDTQEQDPDFMKRALEKSGVKPSDLYDGVAYLYGSEDQDMQSALQLFYYYNREATRLTPEVLKSLEPYKPPINVRAKENTIQYMRRRKAERKSSAIKLINLINNRNQLKELLGGLKAHSDPSLYDFYRFMNQFNNADLKHAFTRAFGDWILKPINHQANDNLF